MPVSCRSAPLNFEDLAKTSKCSPQEMVDGKEGTLNLERVKRLAAWDRPASGEAKRADLNGSGAVTGLGGVMVSVDDDRIFVAWYTWSGSHQPVANDQIANK